MRASSSGGQRERGSSGDESERGEASLAGLDGEDAGIIGVAAHLPFRGVAADLVLVPGASLESKAHAGPARAEPQHEAWALGGAAVVMGPDAGSAVPAAQARAQAPHDGKAGVPSERAAGEDHQASGSPGGRGRSACIGLAGPLLEGKGEIDPKARRVAFIGVAEYFDPGILETLEKVARPAKGNEVERA